MYCFRIESGAPPREMLQSASWVENRPGPQGQKLPPEPLSGLEGRSSFGKQILARGIGRIVGHDTVVEGSPFIDEGIDLFDP